MTHRIEVKTEHEDENKMEFTAPDVPRVMGLVNGFELPSDQGWKMSVAYFAPDLKPLRLYVTWSVEDEDIVIIEREGKLRARHTIPAVDLGGPFPIRHIMEWAQYTIQKVQEYTS